MNRKKVGLLSSILILTLLLATPLTAGQFYLLNDYYHLLYGKYSSKVLPFVNDARPLPVLYPGDFTDSPPVMVRYSDAELEEQQKMDINLEGELDLNLIYGGDFSLKRGAVVGAGSEGITDGLKYSLIEKVLLEGWVGERLWVEFNYDSERTEEGVGEESNIYSVSYIGKEDEFLKEVTAGNKELAIEDSRYVPIDEGNQDSFAVRGKAGWRNFYIEGLFRYNEAYEGKKEFRGSKNSVEMEVLDIDYVKGRFFFLPDTGVDENTLQVYRESAGTGDITVDGKDFVLLDYGIDYSFDNTTGRIYLVTALSSAEELILYYEKNGVSIGDISLGQASIIDETGSRADFSSARFPEYFDTTTTYLYVKKTDFNSYWELRNAYYLEDFQGVSLFDLRIELLFTSNKGVNGNYGGLLSLYEIDASRGVILFNFTDDAGLFYPRPFPGEYPYTHETSPINPFDPENPVYGGVGATLSENSVNTLHIEYSYNVESYFLDFNVVPDSVEVLVDGVVLDPEFYTVDYGFGIVTFSESIVKPSSTVVIKYRYTAFGGGDQSLFSALGLTYESGGFSARNLTAYQTDMKGREAPVVGSEGPSALTNSTEVSMKIGAYEEDDIGFYTELNSGFAVSLSNRNVYGSAVVADMEKGDFFTTVSLVDEGWLPASKSSLIPALPGPSLGTRGNVLYKNYWKENILTGDTLQNLDWDIPGDQVFEYAEKAGPYNAGDHPAGDEETSLVIDYTFASGSSNPYAAVVVPLNGENLGGFERFNIVLRGQDISGENIRIYIEILGIYNEDINGNGALDGESSINDSGFEITPEDGGPTVIGTDREGRSNGRIDSEDLNGNGVLDSGPETGVVIQTESTEYLTELTVGNGDWDYLSFDILDLIESNGDVFEAANAVRITLTATAQAITGDASGKVIINKLWFSGSEIINYSTDYLNISEVSVDEDPLVRQNAFSGTYPGLYDELHGNSAYRGRNDLVEKVLKVFFTPEQPLAQGDQATLSRRFASPVNFSFYEEFKMYLYLPGSQVVPSNMDFTLTLLSSENERLEIIIPREYIQQGWNEINVDLGTPHSVQVNDQGIGNLTQYGSLFILKRVSEVIFGLKAEDGDVTSALEIWLDEWHLADSEGYVDKAFFTEGKIGYQGSLLSISRYSLIEDPALSAGYERREGYFYDNFDDRSDRYSAGMESRLFQILDTRVLLSKELINPIRSKDQLPAGLSTDGYIDHQFHSIELDLNNSYIPVLEHSFDRTVTNTKDVELTSTDYRYTDETEYDESVWFAEWVNFPFGLSQSCVFSRSWLYMDEEAVVPAQSLDPDQERDASLNQLKAVTISYGWDGRIVQTYFSRDEEFTGEYVPYADEWSISYAHKLKTIFRSPRASLQDAELFTKTDSFGLGTDFPLARTAGFHFSFDTDFTELNFQYGHSIRDTVYNHGAIISVPFYLFGNEKIEITPGMERGLKGDYKKVDRALSEKDIFAESYPYLVFRLPFFYISPFKGLGRRKDYDAVDIYKTADDISGSTKNTLYNRYSLDTALGYSRWFIPTFIGLSIDGETTREGGSYQQSRGFDLWVTGDIPLRVPEGVYKKQLLVSFEYQMERQYATKVLENIFGTGTEFSRLRSEFHGIKLNNHVAYTRQRQKIGDKKYYLFPGIPDTGAISEKPDTDKIEHEVLFQYLWEIDLGKRPPFAFMGEDLEFEGSVHNIESLKIENIYMVTDREISESFSNIPLRVTLEHRTDYNLTENITFGAYLKTVVGIEEKVFPDSPEGNVLPSMGLEFGISMKVLF